MIPLAFRLRPDFLSDFVGQQAILGPKSPLRQAILSGRVHSMIFWGPPGTGKTTLAKLIANHIDADFISLSAVMAGVKDIRDAVVRAQETKVQHQKPTVLFLDEVHRFNKSQQDAFLPYVEEGIFTFIGATTENPSFALNNALLSRAKVYIFKSLTEQDLLILIKRGWVCLEQEADRLISFSDVLQTRLVQAADGDARRALNYIELLYQSTITEEVTADIVDQIISGTLLRFDKSGDDFYDQISALHKAVRGSSPDGALYWLARMLVSGNDPLYIARRIIRMATEDIGNADPRALEIALNAWQAYERLGSPEGDLALAQAVVFLAVAPKSNAVYTAWGEAVRDAKQYGSLPVPMHICNAPTALMKGLNYGKGYQYDHHAPEGIAQGQTYFPPEIGEKQYYHPVQRGLEIKIAEKLVSMRASFTGK